MFGSRNAEIGIDAFVKLDANNEVQPDVLVRKNYSPCRADIIRYSCDSPELVGALVTNFDSNEKKDLYEMRGVKE